MHIYIPKREILVRQSGKSSLQGWIEWQVRRRDGTVRLQGGGPNLITNAGLNAMATTAANTLRLRCAVGTGSSAPDPAQGSLDNEISFNGSNGSLFNTTYNTVTPPFWGQRLYRHEFGEGSAEGNLTEVAFFNVTKTTMFARALFLDGSDNPTTITVLDDEFLTVDHFLRVYAPADVLQEDVEIVRPSGNSVHDVTIRPYKMSGTSGNYWASDRWPLQTGRMGINTFGLSAVTTISTGVVTSSQSVGSYVNDSFEGEMEGVWDPGNFTGDADNVNFYAATTGSGPAGSFQAFFDPPIVKTADDRLRLEFKCSWGRYEP